MNRLRGRLPRPGDDRGLTLVELLVYSVLLVVALALVGALMQRTVESQRDVRSVAEAASSAQAAAASVETGVRSAAAMKYSPLAGGDEQLIVRTQTGPAGAPVWSCQAWFYDASDKTLYVKRVPSSGAAPAALQVPTTPGQFTTWTSLGVGISAWPSGAKAFVLNSTSPPTTVHLGIRVAAAKRQPVEISTSFTRRPQGSGQEGVGTPCFSP